MNAIKTTAIVEDTTHLLLEDQVEFLKKGTIVEIFLFIKDIPIPLNWRQLLSEIGTYSDDELSGIYEARKELNKWKPIEY